MATYTRPGKRDNTHDGAVFPVDLGLNRRNYGADVLFPLLPLQHPHRRSSAQYSYQYWYFRYLSGRGLRPVAFRYRRCSRQCAQINGRPENRLLAVDCGPGGGVNAENPRRVSADCPPRSAADPGRYHWRTRPDTVTDGRCDEPRCRPP